MTRSASPRGPTSAAGAALLRNHYYEEVGGDVTGRAGRMLALSGALVAGVVLASAPSVGVDTSIACV